MEPQPITLLPPKITVAHQPTEIVMDQEPIGTGDTEEQMSVPHVEAKVMEETETINTQKSLVWEAWHGWEESLWMAHRMQRVWAAALWDELTWEPSLCMRKLTQDEWVNLDKWKVHFLGELEGFEEDEMEADAFGMVQWEE